MDKIDTTINIKENYKKKILLFSEHHNISTNDVIILLLNKVLKLAKYMIKTGKRVKYQSRDNENLWQSLHLYVDSDFYEFMLDLRKVLKWSVSKVVAWAIEKFLDDIYKEIEIKRKNFDNNLIKYTLEFKEYNKSYKLSIVCSHPET